MTATVPGMADKGWTARVATAAGVAAGTGAAQLGMGYGLGVIVWPATVAQDRSEWLGSLGWATWITASATVFGAVVASRQGGVRLARSRWPWRLALAISAGVGALVAVALIALPARSAVRLDAHPPQTIAAGYALVGVVLGVLVAYWAVLSRPVAANLIATAAWLWALAITAIIVELSVDRDSATYLTSWQFVEADGVRYGVIYWPSAILTLTAAFVIGIIAVIPAVRRGDLGLGAAISGAVGPLLVAISFLALSPRLTYSPGPIESAYLIAPYAVLAGLAGSALTVAAGQALAARQTAGSAPVPRPEPRAATPSLAANEAGATDSGPSTRTDLEVTSAPTAIPADRVSAGQSSDRGNVSDVARGKPAERRSVVANSTRGKAAGGTSATSPIRGTAAATSPIRGEAAGGKSAASTRDRAAEDAATDTPTERQPKRGWLGFGRSKASKPDTSDADTSATRASAADTATDNSDTKAKSEAEPVTGRAKLPNQSKPVTEPSPSNRGPSPTPSAVAPAPQPSTASGPATPSLRPIPDPPKAPTPLTEPPKAPAPISGRPVSPRPTTSEPAGDDEDSIADPEIAAAARTSRPRGKKAAPARKPADPKPTKSTVTPPPATPTIAQINPKPPADD